MASSIPQYLPATKVLVGWTKRRIADAGRQHRVEWLKKIGGRWMVDFLSWEQSQTPAEIRPPTVEEWIATLSNEASA